MENILVNPTRVTPSVSVDYVNNIFELKGKSSPENAPGFYGKILEYLDSYNHSGDTQVVANFELEYFNTSTSKCLYDVFRKLQAMNENGKDVTINWFYEDWDEDMLEAGEDYNDLIDMDFNFCIVEE